MGHFIEEKKSSYAQGYTYHAKNVLSFARWSLAVEPEFSILLLAVEYFLINPSSRLPLREGSINDTRPAGGFYLGSDCCKLHEGILQLRVILKNGPNPFTFTRRAVYRVFCCWYNFV